MRSSMSLANEVIREIRTERLLTVEQLAVMTGYSKTSVNAFELGLRTVPADYLAGLFKHTQDPRLPQLVDPWYLARLCDGSISGQPANHQQCPPATPVRTPPPGDPMDCVTAEIEATKKQAALLQYVYRIVRDGLVNEQDDGVLTDYLKHANELDTLRHRTSAALMHLRSQSEKKT